MKASAMQQTTEFEADPEVDQLLVAWRRGLDGDDAQWQRMRAAVESQLAGAVVAKANPIRLNQQRGIAPSRQRGFLILVMASVLCLALTAWLLDSSPKRVTLRNPQPEADLVSFTAADLQQQAELVCELDRVFEHQLVGVQQRGETVSIDITSSPLTTAEVPQLMMRFVWQQREGGGVWTTVKQEEVIGPLDHQFGLLSDSRLDAGCWSHLLPDHSLWMETTMTQPGGGVVRRAAQYQLNRPAEVWSQSSGEHHFRMLLVYEILKPCGRGVI